MRGFTFCLALVPFLAGTPVLAACPFSYSPALRDKVILPALSARLGADYWKQSGGSFNLDNPERVSRPDGNVELIFHEKQLSPDGPDIAVILDPCQQIVTYARLRSNIVTGTTR